MCHLSDLSFNSEVMNLMMGNQAQNRFGEVKLENPSWNSNITPGAWTKNVNSGGSSDKNSFNMNPQYVLDFTKPDGGIEKQSIISLGQKPQAKKSPFDSPEFKPIGIDIFKVRF